MNEKVINKIVKELIGDLTNRQGFDNVWDDCDLGIQNEIIDEWREIIRHGMVVANDLKDSV